MADWTSIARPYAKALFEHACEHNLLAKWSDWLFDLSAVVSSPDMQAFLNNPETTTLQHSDVICGVLSSFPMFKQALPETLVTCVHVLAENKRLPVVPEVFEQYEALRADKEARVAVQIKSFSKLSSAQEARLVERLTKRFNKTVELEVLIDPTLLGGAVISIPRTNWVLDGSAIGQLEKLSADLAVL